MQHENDRQIWIECALLAGMSILLPVLMNWRFGRRKPSEPLAKVTDIPAKLLDKPAPEEKAEAEPAGKALEQATAQIDSPEKADQVAERLEKLAGSATTGDIEQSKQPEKTGMVTDKVAESSRQIEHAANREIATGIARAAWEITTSPGREQIALSEVTHETLNPEHLGVPDSAHRKQREYLRQAMLKRMKPFDALDASIFLGINHLPHNRWLNGFFRFITLIFTGGLSWYLMMVLTILFNPRKGTRVLRHVILPLSASSSVVEFPVKAFFHRSRPFIAFIQAIVIGKKPSSYSFPSGHSASAFAGAWLLSREFPRKRPLFFLIAALVGFSRVYLGDHYPGDVASGALSGMAAAEVVQRVQRVVLHDR